MNVFRLSLIFAILLFFQSCGSAQKEENIKKRAEVIAIHDEVMPKLGKLKSQAKLASERAGELAVGEQLDSLHVQSLQDLAVELNEAYEAMFVWMRQYETEDGELTPEEVKTYLDEQLILVTEVNIKIKSSLSKADSLLQDH
jgi:hypothetical protein